MLRVLIATLVFNALSGCEREFHPTFGQIGCETTRGQWVKVGEETHFETVPCGETTCSVPVVEPVYGCRVSIWRRVGERP